MSSPTLEIIGASWCGFTTQQVGVVAGMSEAMQEQIEVCYVDREIRDPSTNEVIIPQCTAQQQNGINAFPTIKHSDGSVIPGYHDSHQLTQLMN